MPMTTVETPMTNQPAIIKPTLKTIPSLNDDDVKANDEPSSKSWFSRRRKNVVDAVKRTVSTASTVNSEDEMLGSPSVRRNGVSPSAVLRKQAAEKMEKKTEKPLIKGMKELSIGNRVLRRQKASRKLQI